METNWKLNYISKSYSNDMQIIYKLEDILCRNQSTGISFRGILKKKKKNSKFKLDKMLSTSEKLLKSTRQGTKVFFIIVIFVFVVLNNSPIIYENKIYRTRLTVQFQQ